MVAPFIALPGSVLAIIAGSIGWKQVISLRLTSMPNLSLRSLHVGPAGLGLPPRGRRLSDNGSDPFLESVDSWVFPTAAVARPAGLPLAHLGL